jgi:ribonuclease HI
MKKVVIYSRGSCDHSTREGVFAIQLEYMGRTKNFTGSVSDTTAHGCIIQGCIEGVKKLKEPCKVELITSTHMGISKYMKGKGVNKGLISELIDLLESNGSEYLFTVIGGQSHWLNNKIANVSSKNT